MMFYSQHLQGQLEEVSMSKQVSRAPQWTIWQIYLNIQSQIGQQAGTVGIACAYHQEAPSGKAEPKCQKDQGVRPFVLTHVKAQGVVNYLTLRFKSHSVSFLMLFSLSTTLLLTSHCYPAQLIFQEASQSNCQADSMLLFCDLIASFKHTIFILPFLLACVSLLCISGLGTVPCTQYYSMFEE